MFISIEEGTRVKVLFWNIFLGWSVPDEFRNIIAKETSNDVGAKSPKIRLKKRVWQLDCMMQDRNCIYVAQLLVKQVYWETFF